MLEKSTDYSTLTFVVFLFSLAKDRSLSKSILSVVVDMCINLEFV